jgi:hypothetical protein
VNFQPSTLAAHSLVAIGSALWSSVWVIQPSSPGVWVCFRADVRDDFRAVRRAGRFATARFLVDFLRADFFAILAPCVLGSDERYL